MTDLDVTTIVSICLAVAAIVGIYFAASQYRHFIKQRRTEMLIRIYPGYSISQEELRAAERQVNSSEYEDFSDFIKKYGDPSSGNPVPVAFDTVGNYYEGVGVLLDQKLIDVDLVYPLIGPKIICYWEKMLPFTNGLRKAGGGDSTWAYFEFLYDAMKRESNEKGFQKH